MDNGAEVSDIQEALKIISQAVVNQPGNEAEIWKALTQLPAITKIYLPYDFTNNPANDGRGNFNQGFINALLNTIAKGFTDHLKNTFHPPNDEDDITDVLNVLSDGQIAIVCECIENLVLLGGQEFAKEKFSNVLSWRVDLLLQQNMEYVAEVVPNLKQVEANFSGLISNITVIAQDANKILFLCETLDLTYEQQMDFISDPILEKLSIELLTLTDALKEAVLKQQPAASMRSSISSNQHYNLFSALTATIGEETFFKTDEIIALSNILDLFLGLESKLINCEYTKLLKNKLTAERSKKSALKPKSQLPDLIRSGHQSSLIRSSHAYGQWNWQEILKEVGVIMARSIGRALDSCQTDGINATRKSYYLDDSYKLSMDKSSSSSVFHSNSGIPKKAISCFTEIMNLMKLLLPLAVLGSQYKPLMELRSLYIDECGQALKSMKSFLMTVLSDVPSKGPVINLYYALATCEDVCTMLTYCISKMQPEPRIPFQGILQVYKDLNKTFRNTIVQHQSARLSTYLLHDAESHHWSDPHELNEGESPSYSVQMWNLFLRQLWFELGTCVSEVQRHKIFTEIFASSLDVLDRRYSLCKPSYNRSKQVKLDITTILFICRSFLFQTNFHPTAIFPLDLLWSSLEIKHVLSKIHSSCQNLLYVLCLSTCPLDLLSEAISSLVSGDTHHTVNWLSWVHPAMFPSNWDGRFNSLPDKAAAYCAICYIEIHESLSLVHCLYALVIRKCCLLKKLISGKLVLHDDKEEEVSFDEDVFTIFSSCSHSFSQVFYKCAFKSTAQDAELLLKASIFNGEFTYAWQKPFFSCLLPTMCKSLLKVGRYIYNLTWSQMGSSLISSLPSSLRQQVVDLSITNRSEQAMNCLLVCMILTMQGIVHCMYNLPEWLEVFLSNVNTELRKIQSANCLFGDGALHVLVHAASSVLSSSELWEQHCGIELRRVNMEFMQLVAEKLIMLCEKDKMPSGTKQIQEIVCQEVRNLKQASAACFDDCSKTKDEYRYSDDQLLEECCRQITVMSKNEKVMNKLESIKKMLVLNCHVIQREWGFGTHLASLIDEHVTSGYKSGLTEASFNPIMANRTIGNDPFSHTALVNFSWEWEPLCRAVLSTKDFLMSQALVNRRWEMREDAFLQNDERELVEKIRRAFIATQTPLHGEE